MSGRPKFKPTNRQRRLVEILSAGEFGQAEIAVVVGCDEKTLRRYFSDELEHGPMRVRAVMLRSLYRAAQNGNVTAQRALLQLVTITPPRSARSARKILIGKKERASAEAQTAEKGTVWDDLINPDRRRAN